METHPPSVPPTLPPRPAGTSLPPALPPELPQPLPVASIAYGSRETDLARDGQSLDREMAARLCKTFGWCLLALAAAMFALLSTGGSIATRTGGADRGLLAAFILLGIALPGAVLMKSVEPLRNGGRAVPIVVLVAGLWTVMLFGLWSLGFAAEIRGGSRPLWSYEILQVGLVLALTTGLLKLLYHDVRLLTKPGGGAGREAIVELGERVARAAGPDVNVGLRRLGLVRVATGSLLAAVAGVLTWLTLTPVPPAPQAPPPPQATVPFTGDLHDAGRGLPAEERGLVVRHIEQGLSLDDRQRQLLDDAMREVGRALVDGASWDATLTPGTPAPWGATPRPLGAEEVAWRLPRLGDDAPPAEVFSGPEGLSLKQGCWILTWETDTGAFLVEVNHLVRPSYRARDLPSMRFEGDSVSHTRVDRTYGAVERYLTRLRDHGAAPEGEGTPGVVTAAQARHLAGLLRPRASPPGGGRRPRPRPPIEANLRPDGVIEVIDARGARTWIGRDGTPNALSPEQHAAAAALVRVPRRLNGSPVAAAALVVAAIASAVVGAMMARAARTPNPPGHRLPAAMPKVLRAHRDVSMVGLFVAIYFLISMVLDEPRARTAAGEPVYVLPTLLMLAWWIAAGFYAPRATLRPPDVPRLLGPPH